MSKVVVASGYFNPLTVAHLSYLKESAKLGRLLVVVNNDKQVELKGSVPFMTQEDRLEIVRELSCVTWAVLSIDEDRSISKTLELLRPDYFTNGGDVRSEEEVREWETCRRLGIEMVFGVGGTEKIRSSSELIRKAAAHV